MAVLALSRAGLAEHPRVQEGLRLIRDRAVRSGGWNYGNKAVFGRPLRPQPAPTGLALLTLAGIDERGGDRSRRAIGYLREALPGVRASASLGWGVARAPRLGRDARGLRTSGSPRPTRPLPAGPTPRPGSPACSWRRAKAPSNSSADKRGCRMGDDRRTSGSERRVISGTAAGAGRGRSGGEGLERPRRARAPRRGVRRPRRVVRRRPRTDHRRRPGRARPRPRWVVGQVGPAQAEPGRAEPRGASDQHASRGRPRRRRGLPPLGRARGDRRRGPGTLPRHRLRPRAVGPRLRARRGEARLRRPQPRRRLDRAQPARASPR